MTRHYDAVVVGGRLSATLCAALLAKRGLRTFLVDQGELASLDAHLLHDLVPSPSGSMVIQRVHEELGIRLESEPRLHPVKPPLQVILPDQRFELEPERARLLAALKRERSGHLDDTPSALDRLELEAGRVGEFLSEAKELPAQGFFSRRAAVQLMRRHDGSGLKLGEEDVLEGVPLELRAALLALLPFVTHLDAAEASDLTLARLTRPVQRWLRGMGRLELHGGLRALILEVAARRAFDEHRGAVARLEPSGKQVRLELVQAKEEITADVVIDASTDLSGIETIPARLQKKELALTLQAAKPKGRLHVMGVELDKAVLPPGMGDYLLLLNGRADPARFDAESRSLQDRPILVVRRPTKAPGRQELVLAHPVSAVRAHAEGLDRLEAAMRARLERLVPFLSEGHPQVHSLTGRGATRDHSPVLPHPLYDPELDPDLGLTGVPMRTPYKNVLLAGPAVLPGLGVEGEYWAALQAVDAACVLKLGGKPKKRLLA